MVSRVPPRPTSYREIAAEVRAAILAGDYAPGDRLPSQPELARSYGVADRTAQRAVEALRAEGLVVASVGKGTYVRPRPQKIRRLVDDLLETAPRAGFYAALDRYGLEAEVHTTVSWARPPAWATAELGTDPDAEVLVRDRVMGVAGQPPLQLATSYLPRDVAEQVPALAQESTGPGGMLARLREAGYELSFEVVANSRMPSPDEAERMGLQPGTPLDTHLRLTKAQDDRVLDCMMVVSDSSRVEWAYRFGPEPA
ncbi:MAG TPA: GntR family transcriptional regulator [Actinomycetes bacterium]|jgi:GntR family transcriptional regulator|nr:GntR family transcriptional regulator [Actinomycetes bacterium]